MKVFLEALLRGSLNGSQYTVDMCHMDLLDLFKINDKANLKNKLIQGREDLITHIVCREFNVTMDLLKNKSRKNQIPFARHLYAYMMYMYANKNKTEISRILERDHTTIIHSIDFVRGYFHRYLATQTGKPDICENNPLPTPNN